VLDLSQVEAGRLGLVKERVALTTIVEEAVGVVERLFQGKGLSISVELPPDLPEIYADRTRIRQVLINLLSNAARFTDVGGATVTAVVEGSDLRVSVIDTGIGIPAPDLPRVFEEFHQLDGSLRRRVGGFGLGLAICKQFVELHGGSIWVESEVGNGTCFHFTLPLIGNVVAGRSPEDWQLWDRVVASRPAALPRVAVSTADAKIAHLFERYLDGYQVETEGQHPSRKTRSESAPPISARIVVCPSLELALSWLDTQSTHERLPTITCVLRTRSQAAQTNDAFLTLNKPISQQQVSDALARLPEMPRSILVVDDDPDMLRLLGRMVRSVRRRCQVWLAGGGEEAIAILRSKRPEVIFLDLVMPGVDGFAVLAEIQANERLRGLPVVLITASEDQADSLTSSLVGVTLGTGLSVDQVMRCVRANLDALLRKERRDDSVPSTAPDDAPASPENLPPPAPAPDPVLSRPNT
jgi:CheY-like chemotaxis protein